MKALALIGTLFLLSSCFIGRKTETTLVDSTGDTVIENSDSNIDGKPQRPYRTKAHLGKFPDSDPVTVDSLAVRGNTLVMQVSYSGGCGVHEFEFVGNSAVMKSLPPKRSVKLVHDDQGDTCEGVVTRVLEIDITELAYKKEKGSEIVLLLEGYKHPITYIFE